MKQNEYPDFTLVPPPLQPTAAENARRLGESLGITIRSDRILFAPWIGRIYDGQGGKLSTGTSLGYLRSEAKFWSAFQRWWPSDYALLGADKTVSSMLAQQYRWPTSMVGDKLIHHHIDNGPLVVAIPQTLHRRLSGAIHGKVTVQAR